MQGDHLQRLTCPHCGPTFASFEALRDHMLAHHRGVCLLTAEGRITVNVNGSDHTLRVEPDWTLYQLIHDRLGLTGTKQFCDRGACGSCTVIMNGKAVLSCMMLAIECDGAKIETAEGIADAGHPLIEAYVKHHAMQCGYCTPGFVVTSKALLDRNPDPTEEDIKQALAGNLCRCGTYPQHVIAVREVAKGLQANKE